MALCQRISTAHEEGPGMSNSCHLSLQKNITEAYQFTKKPPKSTVKTVRIAIPENKGVHNYSIQTLNSTELAKKEMFTEMAKVSDKETD